MSGVPHILVVDDEAEIREVLREYLTGKGYAVSTAESGTTMRAILAERPVHLVILDMIMPGEDGITLARELRRLPPIGIVMLTAMADMVDRVSGLESGADDYLTKPFEPRELLARVRAVLRRITEAGAEPATGAMGAEIRLGRHVLNLDTRRLLTLDGVDVPLTAMEFDLLRTFVERPNRVLTRDQLLDLAHSRDMEPFDRSIDLRIMRLRRKLEEDPAKPEILKTVRGAGYVFVPGGARRER
ncbi:MAG: response regulator [Salinarimonas sp.]